MTTISSPPPRSAPANTQGSKGAAPVTPVQLSARLERFDSFWEGPEDVEKGYRTVVQFYRANYMRHLPPRRDARILVISCGPGYFVKLLVDSGYTSVLGIDSHEEKIGHARRHGLPCKTNTAFEELQGTAQPYDAIICEQELNHLTKDEMVMFLQLAHQKLNEGGRIIAHGLNGANPIVGAETLAQNFDHFNTFTAYSLTQVLEYSGFRTIDVFGLNLYVFYRNPFNYVALAVTSLLHVMFRGLYMLYGKSNQLFTKKIAAVAFK